MVHSVVLLFLFFSTVFAHQHQHDDLSSITTPMEQYSGYTIHETHPFLPTSLSSLFVDVHFLQKQIDELTAFSGSPAPSVTRVLHTHKDVLGRRYVKNLMELAGLSVREDIVGNIFGHWDGHERGLAAIATGSHIDAIRCSGKYDGVVAVLGAIEAINASCFCNKKTQVILCGDMAVTSLTSCSFISRSFLPW